MGGQRKRSKSTSVSDGDWGPVAGVPNSGNKLGKSSHSCGKLSECRECITSVHVISWLMVASITKAISSSSIHHIDTFFLLVMSVTS